MRDRRWRLAEGNSAETAGVERGGLATVAERDAGAALLPRREVGAQVVLLDHQAHQVGTRAAGEDGGGDRGEAGVARVPLGQQAEGGEAAVARDQAQALAVRVQLDRRSQAVGLDRGGEFGQALGVGHQAVARQRRLVDDAERDQADVEHGASGGCAGPEVRAPRVNGR
jgi:hypothetical protein